MNRSVRQRFIVVSDSLQHTLFLKEQIWEKSVPQQQHTEYYKDLPELDRWLVLPPLRTKHCGSAASLCNSWQMQSFVTEVHLIFICVFCYSSLRGSELQSHFKKILLFKGPLQKPGNVLHVWQWLKVEMKHWTKRLWFVQFIPWARYGTEIKLDIHLDLLENYFTFRPAGHSYLSKSLLVMSLGWFVSVVGLFASMSCWGRLGKQTYFVL